MSTISDLEARVEALAGKAAKPAAELDQARADLEAARAAEAERQEGRRADWDRGLLNDWQEMDNQLQAEERQAREDFLTALQEDPVWSAWARMRATWHRRNVIRSQAEGARVREATREGQNYNDGSPIINLNYRDPSVLWATIINAIDDFGGDQAEAERERLQAARDTYAQGTD
ncbi:hypothetical protein YW5DRAFT_01907 [Streptomyces sp. Ncost-T6T-1]|uniref:hypothetical protein n=1 Tax=Streptomyces sp. Ncost-T6T-1 TaxID=1100828 RepID=UPI00080588FA|nr:hypothetical protein [Streptomyces sp. Ncost-T6T-1]SBV00573.1 hypothetical protein YW5DRAFT_01907 [Streptomyces sp. Ncost-T6T-1]